MLRASKRYRAAEQARSDAKHGGSARSSLTPNWQPVGAGANNSPSLGRRPWLCDWRFDRLLLLARAACGQQRFHARTVVKVDTWEAIEPAEHVWVAAHVGLAQRMSGSSWNFDGDPRLTVTR